jgi:NAD(P)-dependent dehydrogenase (short-subunit alcohol dehydrogenase family)
MMKFDNDFKGKTVLVTGSGRGLGAEMAKIFAENGAKVAIADINEEIGKVTTEEIKGIGVEAIFVRIDVSSAESAKAGVDYVVKTLGGLDVLVNNAGVGTDKIGPPVTNIPDKDWLACMNVNFMGTVHCCSAVSELFRNQKHGKVVNISSVAGKSGQLSIPNYGASKAAIINFTQSFALEMAPHNVNVNCVCPGYIYTDRWVSLGEKLKNLKAADNDKVTGRDIFMAQVMKTTPMGREQTARDIAEAVLFLCSESARNITAQSINVDGGSETK